MIQISDFSSVPMKSSGLPSISDSCSKLVISAIQKPDLMKITLILRVSRPGIFKNATAYLSEFEKWHLRIWISVGMCSVEYSGTRMIHSKVFHWLLSNSIELSNLNIRIVKFEHSNNQKIAFFWTRSNSSMWKIASSEYNRVRIFSRTAVLECVRIRTFETIRIFKKIWRA